LIDFFFLAPSETWFIDDAVTPEDPYEYEYSLTTVYDLPEVYNRIPLNLFDTLYGPTLSRVLPGTENLLRGGGAATEWQGPVNPTCVLNIIDETISPGFGSLPVRNPAKIRVYPDFPT
jgi:hypothetical protein